MTESLDKMIARELDANIAGRIASGTWRMITTKGQKTLSDALVYAVGSTLSLAHDFAPGKTIRGAHIADAARIVSGRVVFPITLPPTKKSPASHAIAGPMDTAADADADDKGAEDGSDAEDEAEAETTEEA